MYFLESNKPNETEIVYQPIVAFGCRQRRQYICLIAPKNMALYGLVRYLEGHRMRQILLLIAVSSIAVTSGCKKEPEPSAAPSSSSNVEATSSVSTAAANVGIENQIVGTWVPAGLGSASCQRGDYIKFNKNGSYETGADLGADNGSWQYADGELSFENNPPETVNLLNNDTLILGGSGTWTRCEASEQ